MKADKTLGAISWPRLSVAALARRRFGSGDRRPTPGPRLITGILPNFGRLRPEWSAHDRTGEKRMARATKKGGASPAASKKGPAAAGRGHPRTAMSRTPRSKSRRSSKIAGQATAAKTTARSASARSSKDELQPRVEKLERATMTLRTANGDLQRTVAETAERLSELQDKIDQLENKIAAIGSAGDPDRPADDVSGRSDHDHGDAVPPGVAVSEPEPPGEEDRPVLEHPDRELGSD
jgi:BMFP domain-containing protein YqiC